MIDEEIPERAAEWCAFTAEREAEYQDVASDWLRSSGRCRAPSEWGAVHTFLYMDALAAKHTSPSDNPRRVQRMLIEALAFQRGAPITKYPPITIAQAVHSHGCFFRLCCEIRAGQRPKKERVAQAILIARHYGLPLPTRLLDYNVALDLGWMKKKGRSRTSDLQTVLCAMTYKQYKKMIALQRK